LEVFKSVFISGEDDFLSEAKRQNKRFFDSFKLAGGFRLKTPARLASPAMNGPNEPSCENEISLE
jgi:hypothetical protein